MTYISNNAQNAACVINFEYCCRLSSLSTLVCFGQQIADQRANCRPTRESLYYRNFNFCHKEVTCSMACLAQTKWRHFTAVVFIQTIWSLGHTINFGGREIKAQNEKMETCQREKFTASDDPLNQYGSNTIHFLYPDYYYMYLVLWHNTVSKTSSI